MKNRFFFVLVTAVFFTSHLANAYTDINYTTLNNLTNKAVEDIIKTVGLGADHRPYQSADPLGLLIGIDAGIDVTAISLPQSFTDAMTLIGNTDKIPALIPVPRFNLRKGLPFGLDVGASFIAFKQVNIFGGDIQYAFLKGKGPLDVAARVGYNHSKFWYISASTFSFDLVGSLKIPLIAEPYAGLGWQVGSGSLDVPAGSLPTSISGNQSYSNARFFVGVPVSILFLHITGEYGYSFAGIHTYGLKISLSF